MRSLRSLLPTLALTGCLTLGCSEPELGAPQPRLPWTGKDRTPSQSVVAWLQTTGSDAAWLEEKLAPWPSQVGDRDLGVRQIVYQSSTEARSVVWAAPARERMTAALASPSLTWVAVGVDEERRPFLARGERQGLISKQTVDDPALAADLRAWLGTEPPSALRVGFMSEDSVRVAGTIDEPTVTLVSEHNAVLAYRFRWNGAGFASMARTLVSPAFAQAPYLPIGASYDNFDAVVHDFSARIASVPSGASYVVVPSNHQRLRVHNRIFGTQLQPLRSDDDLLNRPSDLLVSRLRQDGSIEWSRLVGIDDVDDEVYALATDDNERLAVVGRTRRERGRDNSEWHISLHVVRADGQAAYSQTVDVPGNGIAQAASFGEDGSLFVGGTANWLQNPSGISLYQPGRPLLLQVSFDAQGRPGLPIVRDDLLPSTLGHAELRAVATTAGRLWLGGLENGPLTHTGDSDPSLIRADGWRFSWLLSASPGFRTVLADRHNP